MKQIDLTRGMVTFVDDIDYEYLNQFSWMAKYSRGKWYAYGRWTDEYGNKKLEFMHRVILHVPDGMKTDHKDGDGLNNQRYNLRICSYTQNNHNASKRKDNLSGYKGVSWYKNYGKWVARIGVNKKKICLGYFDTKEDAAIAYNDAAVKYHGEYAKPNDLSQ